MSLHYDDQLDFLRWVRGNENELGRVVDQQYFTRATFGRYLEQRLGAVEKLWTDAGTPIERIGEFAHKFAEEGGKVRVALSGLDLEVDYLILCTGHGPQRSPALRKGNMLNPYPLHELCATTREMNHVAILGTGLTAIDCALALLRDNEGPKISMFSRSGMMPDLRADFEEDLSLTQPERLSYEHATLEELEAQFMAELTAHNISLSQLLRYLGKLRRGARNLIDPLPVSESHQQIQNLSISIANRDLPAFWNGFSGHDRKLFYDRYFRFVQAVTAPIPVSTAHLLREAILSTRLRILKGTIDDDRTNRVSIGSEKHQYDVVVDATGRQTSAGQVEFEKVLVSSGVAVAEVHGGIRIDGMSGRIERQDCKESRVYGIGYVTRGSLMYSSSLFQATRNIKKVAASIRMAADEEYQNEFKKLESDPITTRAFCDAPTNGDGRYPRLGAST